MYVCTYEYQPIPLSTRSRPAPDNRPCASHRMCHAFEATGEAEKSITDPARPAVNVVTGVSHCNRPFAAPIAPLATHSARGIRHLYPRLYLQCDSLYLPSSPLYIPTQWTPWIWTSTWTWTWFPMSPSRPPQFRTRLYEPCPCRCCRWLPNADLTHLSSPQARCPMRPEPTTTSPNPRR